MARLRMLGAPVRERRDQVRMMERTEAEGRRDPDARRWYNSWRWRNPTKGLRIKCLERDLFTCQRCGRIETDTSKLVADHIEPHRGSPDLFWDFGNLQCLCKLCHDGEKQREERQGGVGRNFTR